MTTTVAETGRTEMGKKKNYNIMDVLETIIDYRGRTPKKADSGIPTLSAKSVKMGYIDYGNCYYISSGEYKRFMTRGFPKKGDILITTEAPLGNVAQLDRDNVAIAQRLLTIRGKKNVLDNDYLLYYFQTTEGQQKLTARQSGSTVMGIRQEEFRKISINIHNYDEQRKIAAVLTALDDKIALNRRINDKLEAMAKRLYDYWFVQFDFPDENGRPYKSSGGQMVWNETLKREIPEGWEVKRLGEHLNCNEKSISTNDNYNYIQYLDTSNLTENKICSIIKIENPKQYPSRARRIIEENDILFSTVRPSQLHYGIIKQPLLNLIASTGFAVLSCKYGNQFNDIFYRFIIKDENVDTLNKIAILNASSYPSINPSDILNLNICMPTNRKLLIPLGNLLSKYHKIIEGNNNQSSYLTALRDRLLPLLMNGQVVVKA